LLQNRNICNKSNRDASSSTTFICYLIIKIETVFRIGFNEKRCSSLCVTLSVVEKLRLNLRILLYFALTICLPKCIGSVVEYSFKNGNPLRPKVRRRREGWAGLRPRSLLMSPDLGLRERCMSSFELSDL